METIYLIYSVILGLVIGSFLNVCIYRIPREESIAFPPSHCTNCGYRLKWYDLIPLFSYLILRGKCRKCGEKISFIYPLIELITGILFGKLYLKFGFTIEFFKYATLFSVMIVIGMIDYFTTDVYFKTIVFGTIAGAIFILLEKLYYNNWILTYVFGALLGAGIIWLIFIITKAMGEGDIEICFVAGLFLGFKLTSIMILMSFIFGGFIGVILIVLKIKDRKDYIPFGPFIALSTIVTILYGDVILKWYSSLF